MPHMVVSDLPLPAAGSSSHASVFFPRSVRRRSAQPSTVFCGVRESASAPAGTSFVTVVPAATSAPLPTRTGATSCVSLPMKTSSPMTVLNFE